MSQKDIQDYLDKGMYGAPKIKPDEQKKYLGTFRERVVFIMRYDEAQKKEFDNFCLGRFKDYPEGTLLINANCPLNIQNHFMKLAQEKAINFRLVDTDESTLSPDDITMVFSIDSPTNIEDISVKEVVKKKISNVVTNTTPEKKGFFSRLFNS